MWDQDVFSAKNRNLNPNSQLMDEYHLLTDCKDKGAVGSFLKDLRQRIRSSGHDPILFIDSSNGKIFCGVAGSNASIMGPNHEYSREADVRHNGKKGRPIKFNHAYHRPVSDKPVIPALEALKSQQVTDLKKVLDFAHSGHEPVRMDLVPMSSPRVAGTDWDRIATEVESRKCAGAFFSYDGTLLKRFETAAKDAPSAAQKKTILPVANRPSVVPKGSGCLVASAAVAGIGLLGWAAFTMMKRSNDRKTGPASINYR